MRRDGPGTGQDAAMHEVVELLTTGTRHLLDLKPQGVPGPNSNDAGMLRCPAVEPWNADNVTLGRLSAAPVAVADHDAELVDVDGITAGGVCDASREGLRPKLLVTESVEGREGLVGHDVQVLPRVAELRLALRHILV